jgi:hypothetical protein
VVSRSAFGRTKRDRRPEEGARAVCRQGWETPRHKRFRGEESDRTSIRDRTAAAYGSEACSPIAARHRRIAGPLRRVNAVRRATRRIVAVRTCATNRGGSSREEGEVGPGPPGTSGPGSRLGRAMFRPTWSSAARGFQHPRGPRLPASPPRTGRHVRTRRTSGNDGGTAALGHRLPREDLEDGRAKVARAQVAPRRRADRRAE